MLFSNEMCINVWNREKKRVAMYLVMMNNICLSVCVCVYTSAAARNEIFTSRFETCLVSGEAGIAREVCGDRGANTINLGEKLAALSASRRRKPGTRNAKRSR